MTGRGELLFANETLITESCYSCGLLFAMTADYRNRKLEDHSSFYCPNGHSQGYIGETKEQKAKKAQQAAETDAAAARRQLAYARTRALNAEAETRRKARQLSAAKGNLTKAKKRAAAGVCPCCHRTFSQVQRHMTGKHPEFVAEVGLEQALAAFTPAEPS